ncbi:MAG TPA: 4-(cytidine 5'-diphospho)-2-C-methyl-D-erythritol kinase, partial [Candidatus Aminicenantes bacterium]|nr:4-(cytidine 5'-diphospho)-2-C-methyl-D-erythritol kinase [Candidatus Aminicenantes bacterium]
MKLRTKASAKVNLFLEVIKKREDGYHDICGIFQSIPVADEVTVITHPRKMGVHVSMKGMEIPEKENTATKAARAFLDYYEIKQGVEIHIDKRIPMGGGLGGSSADAAAVVNSLGILFKTPLEKSFINKLAFVGADIPFMLTGGTALVEGMGERVTPLFSHLDLPLVIGYPGVIVDSGWAYGATSFLLTENPKTCTILLRCLKDKRWDALNDALFNRFEQVVFEAYPQISRLKAEFLENGARAALMSGSGSCVFGVFDTEERARAAVQ